MKDSFSYTRSLEDEEGSDGTPLRGSTVTSEPASSGHGLLLLHEC